MEIDNTFADFILAIGMWVIAAATAYAILAVDSEYKQAFIYGIKFKWIRDLFKKTDVNGDNK